MLQNYAQLSMHLLTMVQKNPRALLAKCDVKSPFKLLPVHHDEFDLLGFAFEGEFCLGKALLMRRSI